MSVLNENTIIGASAAGEYEIEQSLRFDDGRSTYLSRTPSVAGNRKTWTWSGWVKRGNISGDDVLFSCGPSSSSYMRMRFINGAFEIASEDSALVVHLRTTALFRDSSAWYHVIVAMDTTQSTSSNRTKFYINGILSTAFSISTYPSLNADTLANATVRHTIGTDYTNTTRPFDGYMGEVNFIDGQALTPDNFGETGDYGEWKPKAYAGTYGTNGFYLPFEQDYTVEGFSTVVYEGNGASSHYIGGTGFKPDFLWIKRRDATGSHCLLDAIRGVGENLHSNTTASEQTDIAVQKEFNTDGFTVGNHQYSNYNGGTYVAWNWDMGGTTASNTSGSITSSVRANTTYGQSIVSYTSNGSTGTIGHGLGAVPDMIIVKTRNIVERWCVFHTGSSNAYIYLNETFAAETGNAAQRFGNNTSVVQPTSSVFTVGQSIDVNKLNSSSTTYIAYCFSSVTGYSSFGSYSGNGSSTGPVITLGFSPAFVMIKRTDVANQWNMWDNTRSPNNPANVFLMADQSSAENTSGGNNIDFNADGFQLKTNGNAANASGGTYIYAAFADTREYAYWYDQSGNNNDWTSEGGLTESDVMLDSPTNNFATLNPLAQDQHSQRGTTSEGNLKATGTDKFLEGTFKIPASGKTYFEMCAVNSSTSNRDGFGIGSILEGNPTQLSLWRSNGIKTTAGGEVSYGATWTSGDILSCLIDSDAGTVVFYKNGVSQGTAYTGYDFSTLFFPTIYTRSLSTAANLIANFGQDSSFAGNKTPQGNQDSNDIGDFYYAPPTGFLALCTANLPDVDVIPSENFNAVIYTGNSSTQSITGVGFQPDWAWIKMRSAVSSSVLYDSVRGVTKALRSDRTDAESTRVLTSFDTDGFTLNSGTPENGSGYTYVAWNWKAGGSASSNTNGSITSSVSANPSAGFSIVSWVGTNTTGSVGHSLSQIPELIISKSRTVVGDWIVPTTAIDGSTDYSRLNTTNAFATLGVTASTASVFYTAGGSGNRGDMIAYCFHSVDGYSKVGSYTGNGSADGPFVHCGFKPAWVMVKRTNASGNSWRIFDKSRSPDNAVDKILYANLSNAETTQDNFDFVSNGLKLRGTSTDVNANGGTYIFLAFAESPFKNSNAR